MLKALNRASGVEMVLLRRSLVVTRLAVCVAVGPRKSRPSPPAQLHTRAKRCFMFAVSDFTSGRYIAFMDEEDGVCTSNSLTGGTLLANTLSESAEVVCHAAQP
jgi:hypothetical protein